MQEEYLKRPLISDVNFYISDYMVRISCPHTLFVNAMLFTKYSKAELTQLYNEVCAKAKEDGVRISYNHHIHRTLQKQWVEYEITCQMANELFANLILQARVVAERGIHRGYSDDEQLDKLFACVSEYNACFERRSIMAHIEEMKNHLLHLSDDLFEARYRPDLISL